MRVSVEREACCGADDQAGPLEMDVDLPEDATLKELAEIIAQSKFLQFSFPNVTIFGETAGQTIISINAFPGSDQIDFFADPENLLSTVVSNGRIRFKFPR